MAARRLLILMLLLLAISTVAAALVPPQTEREGAPRTAGAPQERTGPADEKGPPGRLVTASISADSPKPRTVRLERGDQLALVIRSRRPDQVEIPAFGQLEDVSRDDPARFDLLPDLTGAFEVRVMEADRVIGRIVVGPREPRRRRGAR